MTDDDIRRLVQAIKTEHAPEFARLHARLDEIEARITNMLREYGREASGGLDPKV